MTRATCTLGAGAPGRSSCTATASEGCGCVGGCALTAAAAAGLWMGFAECADCPMLLQPGPRPLTQCPVSRLPASPWRLPGLDEQPLLLPSPLQRRVHPQARGGCVRCGPGGRRLAAHAGGGPGRPAVRVRLEQGGWAGWGFWWAGEEEQHRQLLCSATCLSLVAQAEIVGRSLQCKPDLPAALPALTRPPAVWAVRRGQQRRSGGGTAASAGAPSSRHWAGSPPACSASAWSWGSSWACKIASHGHTV